MNLLSIATKISSLIMLSRITGLLRETLIARMFGVSEYTDIFNIAFRLPNLLRRVFAEGAFSQIFIPLLKEESIKKDKNNLLIFVSAIATLLFWSVLIVSVIGIIIAPILVYLLASGLSDSNLRIASVLTRLMFPYIIMISMVSLSSSILNSHKIFGIPAFTPALLNLSMIASSLLFSKYFIIPSYALVIGVLFGGILQLAIQVPALIKINMLPKIGLNISTCRIALSHPAIGKFSKLMFPALFSISVSQFSMIINTNIASHLTAGSVSWLSYADRLMELPTALFGVTIGTVLLPILSNYNLSQKQEKISMLMDWSIRITLIFSAPSALILFIFQEPIVAVLYHYGNFTAHDVHMTSLGLGTYGIGLIGLVMTKIFIPVFYSQHDIKTPVKISIYVLILTQILNYIFVPYFFHAGLSLSISIGALVNAFLLWYILHYRCIIIKNTHWSVFFIKLMIGLLIIGFILKIGAQYHNWIELGTTPFLRISLFSFWISFAGIAYFLCLWLLGFRIKDFLFKD